MRRSVPRTDTSTLGHWWWTVDRWTLAAVGVLIGFGLILALAASPTVAARINLDEMYFVRRHLTFLPLGLAVMVAASLLRPSQIKLAALGAMAALILLLLVTLAVGQELNGARRWLRIAGFSLQASEFVKPVFAVVAAWLFALPRNGFGPGQRFGIGRSWSGGIAVSIALYFVLLALLIAQPDVGQAVVLSGVWVAQFFLAGLSMWLVAAFALLGAAGLVGAYFALPHVTRRIDAFLDPANADSYQIDRSLEAFANGGLFGRGPGEGLVKTRLPDAHTDFVFAVAGEEMGILVTLIIVALFAFIVLRGFARALAEDNLFVLLAATGLVTQFGLQALINMGSALQLIPTKGMTLPFISYGGSSMLATCLGIGMLLGLTRRRAGAPVMA